MIAAGATPLLGRRLQEDALLDTGDGQLRQRQCVLRVRVECGKSRLTFKGPVQPGILKIREELETVVGDGTIVLRVLEELGLRVWFRYEKYREEFAHEDVIVAIDETPVGVFVEIEGSESGIASMAQALGRSPRDYLVDSYRALFVKHRAGAGAHRHRHGLRRRVGWRRRSPAAGPPPPARCSWPLASARGCGP